MSTTVVGGAGTPSTENPVFVFVSTGPREKVEDSVIHRAGCDTIILDSYFTFELTGKPLLGADLKAAVEAYGSRIVMTNRPVLFLVLLLKGDTIDLSTLPSNTNVYFPMGGGMVDTVRTFIGEKKFVKSVSDVYEAIAKLTASLAVGLPAVSRSVPTPSLVSGAYIHDAAAVTSDSKGVAKAYLEASTASVPQLEKSLSEALANRRASKK